ncbi:MAG: hypothetical protein WC733_06545 [Methylophilus sp.]|jgi:hypothetical protein
MRFINYLWFMALLLAFARPVFAQDGILISCADSPKEAVLSLPEPLNHWGSIYCTQYGHTVAAKERWIWSFPGALAPVHLPAQMVHEQPKEVGNTAYFKQVDLQPLVGIAADDAAKKINESLRTRSDSPVANAYRLTLTNQDGKSHVVLLVQTADEVKADKGLWAFWCDEDCKDGMPFMLLNYEGAGK